jgi:hypothetical protein
MIDLRLGSNGSLVDNNKHNYKGVEPTRSLGGSVY